MDAYRTVLIRLRKVALSISKFVLHIIFAIFLLLLLLIVYISVTCWIDIIDPPPQAFLCIFQGQSRNGVQRLCADFKKIDSPSETVNDCNLTEIYENDAFWGTWKASVSYKRTDSELFVERVYVTNRLHEMIAIFPLESSED